MTESKEGKRTWGEWWQLVRYMHSSEHRRDLREICERLDKKPEKVLPDFSEAFNDIPHHCSDSESLLACAETLANLDPQYQYLIDNNALEDTASAILDWGNKQSVSLLEKQNTVDCLLNERSRREDLSQCFHAVSRASERQERLIRKLERKNAVLESKAAPKTKKKAVTKTKRKGK